MHKAAKKYVRIAAVWFLLFGLLTIAVLVIDVQPIGPESSRIGLTSINAFMFDKLGVSNNWHDISAALGYIAILVAIGFAVFGVYQAIRRKGIQYVDRDILALAVFYVSVALVYVLFEVVVVNYRPILIDGILEPSYPSSHTMLVVCILSTAIMQFHNRIKTKPVRVAVEIVSVCIIAITIIGRLLSGVHWFTDIVGGVLLSLGLVTLYYAAILQLRRKS